MIINKNKHPFISLLCEGAIWLLVPLFFLFRLFYFIQEGYPLKTEISCDKNFYCTYNASYLFSSETMNFKLSEIKNLKIKKYCEPKHCTELYTFYLDNDKNGKPIFTYYQLVNYIVYERLQKYLKSKNSSKENFMSYFEDLKESDFLTRKRVADSVKSFPKSIEKYKNGFHSKEYIEPINLMCISFIIILLIFIIYKLNSRTSYNKKNKDLFELKPYNDELVYKNQKVLENNSENPVKFVNDFLEKAIEYSIKEIHIEQNTVKYLKNGLITEEIPLPLNMEHKILNRLKILSKINTYERNSKKEGSFLFSLNGKDYKFFVTTDSIHYEERMIIKLKENLDIQQNDDTILEDVIALLPVDFIKINKVLPLSYADNVLTVGMVNPNNIKVVRDITFLTGLNPKIKQITDSEFMEFINKYGL